MKISVNGKNGFWNGKYYESNWPDKEVRIYINGSEINCNKKDINILESNKIVSCPQCGKLENIVNIETGNICPICNRNRVMVK